MSSLDRHALAWLHDHHATISSEALRANGITIDQRKNLVHSGLLERVVDGAYPLGAVDVGELERCAALCTSRPHSCGRPDRRTAVGTAAVAEGRLST